MTEEILDIKVCIKILNHLLDINLKENHPSLFRIISAYGTLESFRQNMIDLQETGTGNSESMISCINISHAISISKPRNFNCQKKNSDKLKAFFENKLEELDVFRITKKVFTSMFMHLNHHNLHNAHEK